MSWGQEYSKDHQTWRLDLAMQQLDLGIQAIIWHKCILYQISNRKTVIMSGYNVQITEPLPELSCIGHNLFSCLFIR